VRPIRIVCGTFALLGATFAAATAAPVRFDTDSFPVLRGRIVHLDFNPSRLVARAETPNSVAFFLPRGWTFDARAVKRECTSAQAAAVRCPHAAQIGFGHVVAHVSGYLFPGGATDGVAYLTPFLGRPVRARDLASIVLEVEYLSAEQLVKEANRYLGTHIPVRSSVVGRLFRVSGRYAIEASFSGFPGGITIPPAFAAAGVRASVTKFKLQVGAVRRVRKPFVHVIRVGSVVKRIHDHRLIGYHLFRRPSACPSPSVWPWRIDVGFPQGRKTLAGTVPCYG
jgi:hypothetical protein